MLTPGPWEWHVQTVQMIAPETRILGIHTGELIFECRVGPGPADGQLMSAAPDMLEALEELLGDFDKHPDDFMPAWHKARVAVAKAKAEPQP